MRVVRILALGVMFLAIGGLVWVAVDSRHRLSTVERNLKTEQNLREQLESQVAVTNTSLENLQVEVTDLQTTVANLRDCVNFNKEALRNFSFGIPATVETC